MKALLLALLPAAALSLGLAGGASPTTPQDHEESPLEEAMLDLEEAVGKLRRTLRDEAKTAESLEYLLLAQRATFRARLETPSMTADLPEADRAAFQRDYRKVMVELLTTQLRLETALLDGDLETARATFKEMRPIEDKGHDRFTHDE